MTDKMPKCFKCEKPVEPALLPGAKFPSGEPADPVENAWECPQGVVFDGGSNFGSGVYDAMLDGVSVRIVVCDDCLIAAAPDAGLLREIKREEKA